MLSLKEYYNTIELNQLNEGNELQQRVNKHITKGVSIGAISPEGPHTDTPEKLEHAHKVMKLDLEAARKGGHIGGWSGPHKGQYKYDDSPDSVAKESSYLVHAKNSHENSHHTMVGALSRIGEKHNQESVLSVSADKSAKWHYLKGEHAGKTENKGKMKYDRELKYNKETGEGTGRTEMKKGGHSFTSV